VVKKRLYVIAALVLAVVLAGCGGSGSGPAKVASSSEEGSSKTYPVLRWGESPFPGALDLQKTLWGQVGQIESLVAQDLVEYEPNGTLKPELASSIENPTPTTYIYRIRSGVKFSDGHPLTVADVVYSLTQNLAGKESVMQAFWLDVASVSARGSSAVVVKLKHPDAVWPDILAFSSQIYEKAAAEKMGEKALGTPADPLIGTGPWKIDSFTPETGVQLSRNPYWTGPTPPAEKVVFTFYKSEGSMALALRSGAIDGASWYDSPKLFVNISNIHLLSTAPRVGTTYVGMNMNQPPFNDVHVRRAIAYATNVEGMIKALFPAGAATVDTTVVPHDLFSGFPMDKVNQLLASLPRYSFDLATAKRELAKSAYPHGFSTEVQALATEPVKVETAEILASDLASIGIKATVHEVQPSEVSTLQGSKVKIEIAGRGAIYADPEAAMSVILPPSDNELNFAGWKSPEADKLLEEQGKTLDSARRLQMIEKLLTIVNREAPYIALYSSGEFASLSNKYVLPRYSEFINLFTPWAMQVKLAK
jgi:peptide/nickel transport system substrate-binding protein